MGYLNGKKLYLAGPIEYQSGPNWRLEVVKHLTEEFGIEVFDPHADEKEKYLPELLESKARGDFDTTTEIARKFVRSDLGHLDRCDIVLANIPSGIPTVGTVEEILTGLHNKKPVILVCEDGKRNIPSWYYGIMNHNMFFGSFNETFSYLREVNDGKHREERKWAFVCGMV